MNRRLWIAFAFSLAFVTSLAACGDPARPKAGGETHWLAACTDDGDCGSGQCICHICSRSCDGDDACSQDGVPARCIETSSTALDRACDGQRAGGAEAVCIADCGPDANCEPGLVCVRGACIPNDSTLDTLPTLDPRDFADAAVQLDFSQPPVVPRPRRTFDGYPASLAGEWLEDCEGPVAHLPGCMTLSLQPGVGGSDMVGAVSFTMPSPAYDHGWSETPPEPASDASVGYPPGLDEGQLIAMYQVLIPGFRYRLLDPRYEAGQLSFWISPVDLWTDWCGLQTSYLYEGPDDGGPINKHRSYRCVPQINPGDIDANKWDLCTGDGFVDAMNDCGDDNSCIPAACSCDPADCVAATAHRAMRYVLSVDRDAMLLASSEGAHLNKITEETADPGAGLFLGQPVALRLRRGGQP